MFREVDVGTLYYAVRQLAKCGLLAAVAHPRVARGGMREVYRITRRGRDRFRDLLQAQFAAEGDLGGTLYGPMLFLHLADPKLVAEAPLVAPLRGFAATSMLLLISALQILKTRRVGRFRCNWECPTLVLYGTELGIDALWQTWYPHPMRLIEIATVAKNHARNAFAEELYLHTGKDFTRPVTIQGIVNEVCNYKCRYCECWRLPVYRPEMSIEEWQLAIQDLKSFLGRFHIEFSGGEPYVKKNFVDLIEFCHSAGVSWGVTTNGSAFLSEKIVRRTVAARPFNINISIDSKRQEIHNYSRGIDGSLDRITEGLANITRIRREEGLDFPVIIKPVVHRLNFRYLPEMVDWIRTIGGSVINFQPVDRWTPETHNELWIDSAEDLADLVKVRDQLLAMKRAGAPILNSELILNAWEQHFRELKAPEEYRPCRVGMRNFFIRPDGDVEVCWYYKPIGNIKTSTVREIWYGEEARQRRQETVGCDSLCLFTCLSQKTLGDKVKMALTLFTGGSKERLEPTPTKS